MVSEKEMALTEPILHVVRFTALGWALCLLKIDEVLFTINILCRCNEMSEANLYYE